MKLIYLTLLHSLWQGFLLAIATGLVLLFTRRATALVRYRLLTGCLGLFAAGMFCTLIYLNGQDQHYSTSGMDTISLPVPSHYLWTGLADFLNERAGYVVGFWFLMVCGKSIQLAYGLRAVYQLKRKQVFDIGHYWQQRVAELAAQSGIHRKVSILQSALAKTPLVIGHLKPLILVPLGLINHLSVAEVEAILRHELAHIRRHDFLVNLLQSVLSILFFFNPAVLWLNQLIREEREHCCDDLALATNVAADDYVRALVSCQSFLLARPTYAMAFARSENQLLSRVRRILHQPGHVKGKTMKLVLAGVLLTVVIMTMVFFKMDGLGTNTIVRRSTEENEQGKIVTEEIVREPAVVPTSGNTIQEKVSPDESSESTTKPDAATLVEKQAGEIDKRAKAEEEKAKLTVCDAANYDALAAIADQQHPNPFTEQDGKDLRSDLEIDGLIKDKTTFSYKLNKEELIVNDVRQPESVHRRYAAKYVQQSGRSILYNYNYTCSVSP